MTSEQTQILCDLLGSFERCIQDQVSFHAVTDLRSLIDESKVYGPLRQLLHDYVQTYSRTALGLQHLEFMVNFQRRILHFDLDLRRFFHDVINQISILVMVEMNEKDKLKYKESTTELICSYDLGKCVEAAKFKSIMCNIWENCFKNNQVLWICDSIDMYNEIISAAVEKKFCVIN